MITDYPSLKTSIATWLHRTDAAAIVADLVAMAEWKIYRLLRIRAMEASFSGTIASGVIALPSDYVDMKFCYLNVTPKIVLERRTAEWIHVEYPTRTGQPRYFARDQGNLVFGPTPDSGYGVVGTYYKRLPALSDSNQTNWFITYAPDLLLFGALAEAQAFYKADARIATWQAKFEEVLAQVQGEDNRESLSGGPITVRAV